MFPRPRRLRDETSSQSGFPTVVQKGELLFASGGSRPNMSEAEACLPAAQSVTLADG